MRAAVTGIGTALPERVVTNADWVARLDTSDEWIVRRTGIRERHWLDDGAPITPLAARACRAALDDAGREAGEVDHLIVSTITPDHVTPGLGPEIAQAIGAQSCAAMDLNAACAGFVHALDLACALIESGRSRVVLICAAEALSRLTDVEDRGTAVLFGDGAGAVVVGADPAAPAERPLFEIVSAAQTVIPDSEGVITMHLTKGGYGGNISTRQVPVLIGDHIERCLTDAFAPLGVGAGWNDLFWDVHPGSSAILDQVDAVLKLKPEKLAASRRVLSEYGNMFGVTVIFVLDELRRRMTNGEEEGAPAEWGVMVAFGPGLTVETMVLHRSGTPAETKLGEA